MVLIIKGFDTVVKMPKVVERLGVGLPRHAYGKEIAVWLHDHIGPGIPGIMAESELIDNYHLWYSQVEFGCVLYHFKQEADATLFRLKFSN